MTNSFQFVSDVVAVVISQLYASRSISLSDCSVVNGHMLAVCFVVCCCPHSQSAELAGPFLCSLEERLLLLLLLTMQGL